MSQAPQPAPSRWPALTLRPSDQFVAATILAAALAVLGFYWTYQQFFGRGLIDIDRAPPREILFLVDVNEADWPELALLPDVGEQLARRIVEYRAEHGPFRDLDQLKDVRGIGPKTFDGMRPYLLKLPDVEATAGEASSAGDDSKS
ncbi:MAG TPA: helix-hairpin-helix domain-containing protein [Pirellulaceae bacterium]|nr:helix-hairpin-helix domain-containing protein [Pirellulaceae bacterium]